VELNTLRNRDSLRLAGVGVPRQGVGRISGSGKLRMRGSARPRHCRCRETPVADVLKQDTVVPTGRIGRCPIFGRRPCSFYQAEQLRLAIFLGSWCFPNLIFRTVRKINLGPMCVASALDARRGPVGRVAARGDAGPPSVGRWPSLAGGPSRRCARGVIGLPSCGPASRGSCRA
jgi:hypothetical protein